MEISTAFEAACYYWEPLIEDFANRLLKENIPGLKSEGWQREKRRVKVCRPDVDGKKKRCAVGPKYYCKAHLSSADAHVVWDAFEQFAKARGLKAERLRNNEQELGRYHFIAQNCSTEDQITCLIDLPGEWNSPRILLSLFIGPRYREEDLPD